MNQCAVIPCEETGNPYPMSSELTFYLCPGHLYDVATFGKKRVQRVLTELDEAGALNGHTAGWTYVVRMANGNVKIGMTKKPDVTRLQGLSRDSNQGIPVQVLSIMKGGESVEILTHAKWIHLKVPGRMEEFYPDPSLLQWAEGQGIHPDSGYDSFSSWVEKRHASGATRKIKSVEAQAMLSYAQEGQTPTQDEWTITPIRPNDL